MGALKKILHKLNGLHYHQEYLCLPRESLQEPLHAYLMLDGHVLKDITTTHLFVGYHPLIFALLKSEVNGLTDPKNLLALFTNKSLKQNEKLSEKDAIAVLRLKMIRQIETTGGTIFFYEGVQAQHRFISSWHQAVVRLYNKWYNRKAGNVFLENNLYTQVQVAYAIPRQISLVTVSSNDLFNLFPTDLHGKLHDRYVISLRHEGKACAQVEVAKNILLSGMHASAYQYVYSLGKNHMQSPKEKKEFGFGPLVSNTFHLPVPGSAVFCRELTLDQYFDQGIHRVLIFRIVSEKALADTPETLAHIHNSYATWLYKMRISSNLLLKKSD